MSLLRQLRSGDLVGLIQSVAARFLPLTSPAALLSVSAGCGFLSDLPWWPAALDCPWNQSLRLCLHSCPLGVPSTRCFSLCLCSSRGCVVKSYTLTGEDGSIVVERPGGLLLALLEFTNCKDCSSFVYSLLYQVYKCHFCASHCPRHWEAIFVPHRCLQYDVIGCFSFPFFWIIKLNSSFCACLVYGFAVPSKVSI